MGSLIDRLGPPSGSRKVAPLPRRRGRGGDSFRRAGPMLEEKLTVDKESLDAELDAFLREREGD